MLDRFTMELLEALQDQAERSTPPWSNVIVDIASADDEQEYGVVLHEVMADYFGYQSYF